MSTPPQLFDGYAAEYDEALERGIAVSGEGKEFFARGRVRWLAGRLAASAARPARVLDYGCGTGSAAPHLLELPGVEAIVGLDVSPRSVEVATRTYGSDSVRFGVCGEYRPAADFDLSFCNGVFHHIPPADRLATARLIFDSLRPGGWFAFWENNPFNPGTRYVMSRIPFDRDAILVWPGQGRRLLREAGFRVERTDYAFIFPKVLGFLRGLERPLAGFPLGAQYMILARKPG